MTYDRMEEGEACSMCLYQSKWEVGQCHSVVVYVAIVPAGDGTPETDVEINTPGTRCKNSTEVIDYTIWLYER